MALKKPVGLSNWFLSEIEMPIIYFFYDQALDL